MSERYFLKYKNTAIGVFEENENHLDFKTWPGADTLPILLGYPFGLYKVDKTSIPWMPNRTQIAGEEEIKDWLSERIFSKNRADVSSLLNNLGLSKYDPWEIVKKTFGLTFHDHFWVTSNEDLHYEEARDFISSGK